MFKWLWDFFKGEEQKAISYRIDPESLKLSNIIKGQANQIAELQGDIARIQAEKAQRRGVQEQIDDDEYIKEHLQKEKIQLANEDAPQFFSLKAFFLRYFNDAKFRNSLRFTTFDRSQNIAMFGDIGFSENQIVILDDKRKVVMKTTNLMDMFESVDALPNDILSTKIPINLDKNGGWIENEKKWDVGDIVETADGHIYTHSKKEPYYERIKEKNAKIKLLQEGTTLLEQTTLKQQERINELEMGYDVNSKSVETARADRSKTAQSVSVIEKIWKDTEDELSKMRQGSALQEDENIKLKAQNEKLMKEAEREGTKLADEKAVETVERIQRAGSQNIPEEKKENKSQ